MRKLSASRRRPYRSAYSDTSGRKLAKRFDQWKRECSIAVGMDSRLNHIGDILAKDDPYDLKAAMVAAFEHGESPHSFIKNAFAEELARTSGEREEWRESLDAMADKQPTKCRR